MEKLVKGFLKFHGEVFGKKKDLFIRLSQKQEPSRPVYHLFGFPGRSHPDDPSRAGGTLHITERRQHGSALRFDARR